MPVRQQPPPKPTSGYPPCTALRSKRRAGIRPPAAPGLVRSRVPESQFSRRGVGQAGYPLACVRRAKAGADTRCRDAPAASQGSGYPLWRRARTRSAAGTRSGAERGLARQRVPALHSRAERIGARVPAPLAGASSAPAPLIPEWPPSMGHRASGSAPPTPASAFRAEGNSGEFSTKRRETRGNDATQGRRGRHRY